MALRGKVPEYTPARFKAIFYGDSGAGKTTTATKFPKPYIIDTEGGTKKKDYVDIIRKNNGAVAHINDFDLILHEVEELLKTKHNFKTLVIDSITVPYSAMCAQFAEKYASESKEPGAEGMEFQRHKKRADMEVKKLLNLVARLDMNVIFIAHSRSEWSGGKEIGKTFDSYGKTDYLSELVLEVKLEGSETIAYVKKTRDKNFPRGTTFPFTYEEISKRHGEDLIEKDAEPESFATEEQILEAGRLIKLLDIPQIEVSKLLNRAYANNLNDMSESNMQLFIAHLKKKLESNLNGEK